MQFYSNGAFSVYLLDITQSVIWNFKLKVKTNRNCSLECKVLNCKFQNIQHSLPCKMNRQIYSALMLRYTQDTSQEPSSWFRRKLQYVDARQVSSPFSSLR